MTAAIEYIIRVGVELDEPRTYERRRSPSPGADPYEETEADTGWDPTSPEAR